MGESNKNSLLTMKKESLLLPAAPTKLKTVMLFYEQDGKMHDLILDVEGLTAANAILLGV